MITRDHLLRQIEQLVQVLAVVLFHKRAGQSEAARQALEAGIKLATETDLAALRRLERGALLALCEHGGVFSSEHALALADLLREDAAAASRERARWLYEAVRDAGELAPLDLDERIADLGA